MNSKRFWTSTFAILLLSSQVCQLALASEADENINTSVQVEYGQPYLTLTRNSDGSLCGAIPNDRTYGANLPERNRILRIGNVFTKGLKVRELQALLISKAGQTVQVEFSQVDNGETSLLEFPTDLRKETWRARTYSNINAVDAFDRPNLSQSSLMAAETAVSHGAVAVAIALLRDIQQGHPYAIEQTPDSCTLISTPFALQIFDRGGAFEDSDASINFSLKMSAKDLRLVSPAEILALAKIAEYCSETQRIDRAKTIWKNLYATISDARRNEQMVVLSGYGEFLRINPALGSAPEVFAKLEAVCLQNIGRNSITPLRKLISYHRSQKNYKKCEFLNEKLIAALPNIPSPEVANYLQYQEQIQSLVQLAEMERESADPAKAKTAYLRALAVYDQHLSSDELVRLERTVSLCYSSVEWNLGDLCLANKNYDEALKFLNSAKVRIQSALGLGSPVLKAVFLSLAKAYENKGSHAEAENCLVQAQALQTPEVASPSETDLSWMSAEKVNKLILQRKFAGARTAVRRLIATFKDKANRDPFELNRIVFLANSFERAKQPQLAYEILSDLSEVTKWDSPSQSRGYVLSELFCAASSASGVDSAGLDKIWNLLSRNEQSLADKAYGQSTRSQSDAELKQREVEHLRRVALLLLFLDQPANAETILRRVIEYGGKPSTTAYATASLAIALIQGKKYAEGVALLEAADKNYHAAQEKLPVATVLLNSQKKSQLAKQLLDEFKEREALKRWSGDELVPVLLEVRLGYITEAIADYKSIEGPNRNQSAGGLLLGSAFSEVGQYADAIEEYFKASKIDKNRATIRGVNAGLAPFERALTLIESKRLYKPDYLTFIREFTFRVQADSFRPSLTEQIARVARKCLSGSSKSELVEQCRNILIWANRFDLASALTSDSSSVSISESSEAQYRKQLKDEFDRADFDRAAIMIEKRIKRHSASFAPFPGNRMSDLGFQIFEKAKRFDILEKLLKAAIEAESDATVAPSGAASIPKLQSILLNKLLLIRVYALERKTTDALGLAKDTFEEQTKAPYVLIARSRRGSPRIGGLWDSNFLMNSSPLIEPLFWGVDDFIKAGDLKTATELNRLVSLLLTSVVGEKHPVWIQSHVRAATIFGAEGEKQKQESELRKALTIASWVYGPQSRNTADVRSKLASVLRDAGKDTEADAVGVIRPQTVPQISEYVLRGKHFILSSHSPPPDFYADTAESALVERLPKVIDANGEPSVETYTTLRMLTDFNLARKRYTEAEKYLLKQLQIAQLVEGTNADLQCLLMEQIAEVEFLRGNGAEAEKWVDKALASNLNDYSDVKLRCAALSLEMGNKERGLKLLIDVANELLHPAGANFYSSGLYECCYLLQMTNQTEMLKKLQDERVKSEIPMHHNWWEPREEPTFYRKDGKWIRETRASRMANIRAQMAEHLPSRQEVSLMGMRSQLEHMKRNAPAGIAKSMEESLAKTIVTREEQIKEL